MEIKMFCHKCLLIIVGDFGRNREQNISEHGDAMIYQMVGTLLKIIHASDHLKLFGKIRWSVIKFTRNLVKCYIIAIIRT